MENITAQRVTGSHLGKREAGVPGAHWIELLRFHRNTRVGFERFLDQEDEPHGGIHTVDDSLPSPAAGLVPVNQVDAGIHRFLDLRDDVPPEWLQRDGAIGE